MAGKLKLEARMTIKTLKERGSSAASIGRTLGVTEGAVRYHLAWTIHEVDARGGLGARKPAETPIIGAERTAAGPSAACWGFAGRLLSVFLLHSGTLSPRSARLRAGRSALGDYVTRAPALCAACCQSSFQG
jgi:hypothetical protein